MQELFNRIDQGLYDGLLLALLFVAALLVALPKKTKEREP